MRNSMSIEQEHRNRFRLKRVIFIPFAVAAGIFIFSYVVMYLWNAILPEVLGVHIITFWQALGILVLSKILFGGFGMHHNRSHIHHTQEMREKWMNLSQEEKDKMKNEWKGRFNTQEKTE
jgi:hypothetical protein